MSAEARALLLDFGTNHVPGSKSTCSARAYITSPDEDFAQHQAPDVVQVSRLRRGEYGIFVTTSYYTRQAQEKVLEDTYPVKLLSGATSFRFFRELRLVAGDHLRGDWLAAAVHR